MHMKSEPSLKSILFVLFAAKRHEFFQIKCDDSPAAFRRFCHLECNSVLTPYLDQRHVSLLGNLKTENTGFTEIIEDSPVIVGDNCRFKLLPQLRFNGRKVLHNNIFADIVH
jgi:hypothetical protein